MWSLDRGLSVTVCLSVCVYVFVCEYMKNAPFKTDAFEAYCVPHSLSFFSALFLYLSLAKPMFGFTCTVTLASLTG